MQSSIPKTSIVSIVAERKKGKKKLFWGLILSWTWLGILAFIALFAGILPLPEGVDPMHTLRVPVNLLPGEQWPHILGTDRQGLDILAGLFEGTKISLTVGLGGTFLGFVIGGVLGMLAGFFGGILNALLSYVVDVFLAFPAIILLLALATIVQPTPVSIAIILGVLAFPNFARLARANTISVMNRDFVVADRVLGAKPSRLLFRSIMPNILSSLLALGFLMMSVLIVAEASLSFLGVGIQRPQPSWGNLIAQGVPLLEDHPTLIIAPTVMIFLTVLATNSIGQHLQKKWKV